MMRPLKLGVGAAAAVCPFRSIPADAVLALAAAIVVICLMRESIAFWLAIRSARANGKDERRDALRALRTILRLRDDDSDAESTHTCESAMPRQGCAIRHWAAVCLALLLLIVPTALICGHRRRRG
jgi:hypothetical protein